MAAMGRKNRFSWPKLCFAGLALRLPLGASEKAPEFMCLGCPGCPGCPGCLGCLGVRTSIPSRFGLF